MAVDLRISVSYLSRGELRRIGDSLKTDPDDVAEGWFIRVSKNEGYEDVLKYTRVSPDLVLGIAGLVDDEIGPPRLAAAARELAASIWQVNQQENLPISLGRATLR